jgi:hypothetical protein
MFDSDYSGENFDSDKVNFLMEYLEQLAERYPPHILEELTVEKQEVMLKAIFTHVLLFCSNIKSLRYMVNAIYELSSNNKLLPNFEVLHRFPDEDLTTVLNRLDLSVNESIRQNLLEYTQSTEIPDIFHDNIVVFGAFLSYPSKQELYRDLQSKFHLFAHTFLFTTLLNHLDKPRYVIGQIISIASVLYDLHQLYLEIENGNVLLGAVDSVYELILDRSVAAIKNVMDYMGNALEEGEMERYGRVFENSEIILPEIDSYDMQPEINTRFKSVDRSYELN